VVKPSEAPGYKGATIGLLVGYAIKAGCHLSLLGMISSPRNSSSSGIDMLMRIGYMYLVNRRRDSRYGPADKARSNEAGMQDRTEFENKDFRYVL
jgi:hypothetical protein